MVSALLLLTDELGEPHSRFRAQSALAGGRLRVLPPRGTTSELRPEPTSRLLVDTHNAPPKNWFTVVRAKTRTLLIKSIAN